MADRTKLVEALKRRSAGTQAHIDAILAAPGDEKNVENHLKSYILLRFALDGTDEENIAALAKMSLKKLDELRKMGVDINDVSPGCSGVSTDAAKKALLLTSLQKSLGIKLDARKAAYIETVPQLAAAIRQALGERT